MQASCCQNADCKKVESPLGQKIDMWFAVHSKPPYRNHTQEGGRYEAEGGEEAASIREACVALLRAINWQVKGKRHGANVSNDG